MRQKWWQKGWQKSCLMAAASFRIFSRERLGVALTLLAGSALVARAGCVPGQTPAAPGPPPRAESPAPHLTVVGYLGAFLGDLPADRAQALNLSAGRGAFVGKVIEGSPAATAGLRENDVILSFNAESVGGAAQIYRLLGETPAGRTVTLRVSRGGVTHDLTVTVGERRGAWLQGVRYNPYAESDAMRETAERLRREAEEARQQQNEARARQLDEEALEMSRQAEERRLATDQFLLHQRRGEGANPRAPLEGLSVSPLTRQLAEFFEVTSGIGVLVTEVRPGSAAAAAGLKAGDCITSLDNVPVTANSDLSQILGRAAADELTVGIVRDGSAQSLKLRVGGRR